jgi:IAA-amino acid hydrolase
MTTEIAEEILSEAKAIEPSIVDVRRRLHQCPELLYELHETSKIVCEELDKLGIPIESGIAETGVVATIGKNDSPCVMLRADMDALAITEIADIDFKSKNEGRMHACGHDCHTAMLLGAAKLLKEREADLPGTVKLIFQPAEEGGAGGKRMCEAGVMENVEKGFALHVWPMIPTGQLTGRPGVFLAATNSFEIEVTGRGGHAAMPQFTIDPITTTAKIISEAQTLISRELDPLRAGVISFTALQGGVTYNVIPQKVNMMGTIRALRTNEVEHLKERLATIAEGIAIANGCTAEFTSIGEDYPETSNDPELWKDVVAVGKRLVGEENFSLCDPVMGGEDFSYYGRFAPTCFVALGIRNESKGCVHGLHHPQFKVDEAALHVGTALHVAFALEHL